MVIPQHPPIPCPDCHGMMVLQFKPAHYVRNHTHPFWYKCERQTCWGSVWAHPDGRPIGIPVNKKCRRLRKAAHEAMDPLWKVPAQSTQYRTEARAIAYLYIADQLGCDPRQAHLGRITDAETLRRFADAARSITHALMMLWWRFNGSKRFNLKDGDGRY